jgi:hypothetical protein
MYLVSVARLKVLWNSMLGRLSLSGLLLLYQFEREREHDPLFSSQSV